MINSTLGADKRKRFHRFFLKSGYTFEIWWSEFTNRYVGHYYPTTPPEEEIWAPNKSVSSGATVKEVIGKVRRSISERENPEVAEVIARMENPLTEFKKWADVYLRESSLDDAIVKAIEDRVKGKFK